MACVVALPFSQEVLPYVAERWFISRTAMICLVDINEVHEELDITSIITLMANSWENLEGKCNLGGPC